MECPKCNNKLEEVMVTIEDLKPAKCYQCDKCGYFTFNYRYKTICKKCGKFISADDKKEHKCKGYPRYKDGRYHCSICNKYLPFKDFHLDSTKRYGISNQCKKCRNPFLIIKSNRRKAIKLLEKIEKYISYLKQ